MAACENAARAGDLQELKRLHESGCPWYEYTCASAAAAGHLDCLKYAHENGCPGIEHDMAVHENVRAYVESVIEDPSPIKTAMAALDDVKGGISDGQYVAIANGLMFAHRAEKARRQYGTN